MARKKKSTELPSPKEVIANLVGQDRGISDATGELRRQFIKLHRDFLARFKSELRAPASARAQANFEFRHALKVINDLNNILADAGMQDFLDAYVGKFGKITKNALDAYNLFGEPAQLASGTKEALNTYIQFSETRLASTLDRIMLDPIRTSVFQATFGKLDYNTAVNQIIDAGSTLTVSQIEVAVDDSYRQYQRAVTTEKGDELNLEIYWYTGAPPDSIISPQCEYLLTEAPHGVPGMWYKDEINADMHPALTDNPLIAGGHPRCRHKFIGITTAFAVEQGFELDNQNKN